MASAETLAHEAVPHPRVLDRLFAGERARDVVAFALGTYAPGRTAVVSSFGADSAVLLHLVASVDPETPVVFLDTGRHFPETLAYRDRLAERLGLADLRSVRPDPHALAMEDPAGDLHALDPDLCCAIRKTEPLERALAGFDVWLTGRRRHQAATRSALPVFERDGTRTKINPLAGWRAADIAHYAATFDLPAHPLVEQGYPSIGCAPCTSPAVAGEDPRAGRWRGTGKTECGIHLSHNGRFMRTIELAGAGCG